MYDDTSELRDLKQSIIQSVTLDDFMAVKKTVEAINSLPTPKVLTIRNEDIGRALMDSFLKGFRWSTKNADATPDAVEAEAKLTVSGTMERLWFEARAAKEENR